MKIKKKIMKKSGPKAENLRNLEVPMPLALLPLWSDFSDLVWFQTIYLKVVWIWSEFSPFSLNFKNNDHVNGLKQL